MTAALRVAALDHFFSQDIDALCGDPRLELRRIDYTRLRDAATRILGRDAGTGLECYTRPALAERRQRYERWLSKELERWLEEWPFDVIVLPSDVFFYVRAVPHVAHQFGIPVAVVQKETTISPDTMDEHAETVGRLAPFASDLMTVCSARQREFWLRAGADPARIVVTGQPRFDVYMHAAPHREGRPHVLFLSYELDAYEPGVGQGQGRDTWRSLRSATEEALLDLVSSQQVTLVVKHHPQQTLRGEFARWKRLAGQHGPGAIEVVQPSADTRRLILHADVIVGFQTTALYESVAARKPTVYAAWGDVFERHRTALIPFDRAPGCVRHATTPAGLRAAILGAEPPEASCVAWYEEALGPVDGRASARTVDALLGLASTWLPSDRYRTVMQARRSRARRHLGGALAREVLYLAAQPAAHLVGRHRGAAQRRVAATERRRRLWTALRAP